ncbi:uncharacterized protein LOC123219406 isoform X3 [Mangifera indica]|uniref:uncharacterized protein LOC123219406 isoform X3 n=1 Tax=Mangifera indica TaxID=29780 RepID=UPI001CFAB0BB|nr:uncharacterized protein LOC123219406 isoform X3 [Mangifera indica]
MASLAFTSFMIHPLPFPPLNTKTKTNNSCFCFPVCRFVSSSEKFNFFSLSPLPKPTHATASSSDQHSQQHEEEEDNDNNDENFEVLTAIRSKFNDIVIVDTSTSRMLLLDHTNNVHSILNKGLQKWTDCYWDEFASLPAIVPKGPIAIYGLGGGTAAHLLLDLWPSLQLEGWEIDEILIDKARDYFGLLDLEKPTEAGGVLHVCIGDVFSPSETVAGRYAGEIYFKIGIIIDLFSEGKVLEQLQEPATWLKLKERLMPNGRFMINCGGIVGEASDTSPPKSVHDRWMQNSTIKALSEAFPGECIILTGTSMYKVVFNLVLAVSFELHGMLSCSMPCIL